MTTPIRWLLLGAALCLAVPPRPADAAASCFPGFNYAAFGKDSVTIGGNAKTDSYNSGSGAYNPPTNGSTTSGGNVGTDGTACGAVDLNGASTQIGGNIQYGPGGAACSVSQGSATVNGTQTALATTVTFPTVLIPALVGTAVTTSTTVSASATWSATPNNTWKDVTVNNGETLTLNAGTYVFTDNLTVKGAIKAAAGATVAIYFSCATNADAVTVNAGGLINAVTPQMPSHFMFFLGPSCTSADFEGGTNASFTVYGPTADITLHGGSTIYGAIIGKTITDSGGTSIHYDSSLTSLNPASFTCATGETSRASPVIASIAPSYGGASQTSLVQGSFDAPGTKAQITSPATATSFTFPYTTGHMRARIASLVSTTASDFSATQCTGVNTPASCSVVFDAGATGNIPSASNTTACSTPDATCRYVFTNTNAAGADDAATGLAFHPNPTKVVLYDGVATTVGPLIVSTTQVAGINGGTYWRDIIRTVIAGKLGGVDRSTAAVIEAGTLAGPSRPKMVYFGATDGMLHAVCAESLVAPCIGHQGQELWAFLPRVELPRIRTNDQRIDGSVRVVDVFGDFTNRPAIGSRTWHTILTFQTGDSGAGASYALDVTAPASPTLLWEVVAPTSGATATEIGTGLTVGAGPALISGQLSNLAVVQTNNGGSGGAGVVAEALEQETGDRIWKFGWVYTNPPRGSGTAVPTSGIPGGAVGVDLLGNGTLTDFAMGDLYGNIWQLDATTGVSRQGTTTPLFTFSTNLHPFGAPPAIYSNSNQQYAAIASGGYDDPTSTSWTTTTQYLVAPQLKKTVTATTSLTEATSASPAGDLALNSTLSTLTGANEKAFSQVLIVGTELLLVSDLNTNDVNSSTYGTTADSGHTTRVNLGTGATVSTSVVYSGGSSLVNSGTSVFSASGQKQQQTTTAAGTAGTGVDLSASAKGTRDLWLRTE